MLLNELFEGWSQKYKRSIDCNNPKGFSQRAHCAGRQKTNEADGKNTHLDHAEELIFMHGNSGLNRVVSGFTELLKSITKGEGGEVSVTTKWDGSPAIFAGTDPEDGKFFVGTKGVFAKGAKLNKSPEDIERNHPDTVKNGEPVSKQGLRDKLYASLRSFQNLNIPGVIQGDLLFTRGDLKRVRVNGKPHIAFKPNTITYVVPADSDLAKRMQNADIGIVWHTSYEGATLPDMTAKFGFDSDVLQPDPKVWYTDARIKDVSGQVQMSKEDAGAIAAAIQDLKSTAIDDKAFKELNDSLPFDLIVELKAHANTPIRSGKALEADPKKFAQNFVKRLQDQTATAISKLKSGPEGSAAQKRMERLKHIESVLGQNMSVIENMYTAYLKTESVKMMFQKHMKSIRAMDSFIQQPDGSFRVTDPEGFVVVDRTGNAMKIVDRLEFSATNFIKD
jgi:hypothetical protein